MAQIIVADNAGACYGVDRALDLVEDAARDAEGDVFTLGPLIHNPRVVAELDAKGVHAISSVDEAEGATLILRTHGSIPQEEERAHALCTRVIDATCPFVKNVHVAAEHLSRDGYEVIVVGETGHPEVEATLAHAPGARAVANATEAAQLSFGERVGVVVQTTQSQANLDEVMRVIDNGSRKVNLINTICRATKQRQDSAAELAAKVDCMVVIGGRNSANTRRLAEICSVLCQNTHHIEDESEIDSAWVREAATIGVTAGASTPASQIASVVDALGALA